MAATISKNRIEDRIERLHELGVYVDQGTPKRTLDRIESLIRAKPSLRENSGRNSQRLRSDEIAAVPRGMFPKVRTICGNEWLVDFCGIMHPGRQWKIDFRGFEDQILLAERFLSLILNDDALIKTPTVTTYAIKHYFQWNFGYVCNGACIVAASRLGIPLHPNGINPRLPVSRGWLRKWEEYSHSEDRNKPIVLSKETGRLLKEMLSRVELISETNPNHSDSNGEM